MADEVSITPAIFLLLVAGLQWNILSSWSTQKTRLAASPSDACTLMAKVSLLSRIFPDTHFRLDWPEGPGQFLKIYPKMGFKQTSTVPVGKNTSTCTSRVMLYIALYENESNERTQSTLTTDNAGTTARNVTLLYKDLCATGTYVTITKSHEVSFHR